MAEIKTQLSESCAAETQTHERERERVLLEATHEGVF